jgi:hypothetical protein
MNVFADDITIEDDMSVLVKYDNGANMTYHLTAYSVSCFFTRNGPQANHQPWEGYRVMFNGDQGRLELEVVESSHRTPMTKGGNAAGATHGEKALPNEGHQKITLQQLWKTKEDVPFKVGTGGHGQSAASSPKSTS